MKLLFYRYNNICEPDIIATFNEFGYEVREFTLEMTKKDVPASEVVKKVSEYLQNDPVDFVFSINFYPALSEVCNIFHIRYISWTVDSPVPEIYSKSIINEWNRTFIFDKEDYNEVNAICEKEGSGHVFHLPLAARIEPKEELFKNTPQSIHDKFSHDVAFVGSLYTEKCPYDKLVGMPEEMSGYLDGVMRAQERVYGYYFVEDLITQEVIDAFKTHMPDYLTYKDDSFITDAKMIANYYVGNKISSLERFDILSRLSEKFDVSLYTLSDTGKLPKVHNMGPAKTLTEMPVIFRNSKINLNPTSKGIRAGLPLRIFDIMSAGGFVLSNFQTELGDLFDIGQDLAVYSSLDELEYLTDYYLVHDDERRMIAENGYIKVKENYSYQKVLSNMIFKAYEV